MEITNIKIKELTPSELNPRGPITEGSLKELSESIRIHGILNPLTVRSSNDAGKGKKYEIICGERRYHASTLLKLKEVPCIIKEVSDEEAIQLMIIENLQREDLTPIHEAKAYNELMDVFKYTITDIALKTGKSESYVAQRLKLLSLIEELQDLLFTSKLPISHALEIAKLSSQDQLDVYDNHYKEGFGSIPTLKKLKTYIERQFSYRLDKAEFDTNDVTLNPSMGSCATCIYNTSAQNLLFPDENDKGKCLLKECFDAKTSKTLERKIEELTKNPEMSFGIDKWSNKPENIVNIIETLQLNPVETTWQNTLHAPDPLDRDDYEDEEDYQEALKEYDKKLAEYNSLKESPEYSPVVMLNGGNPGEIVYVKKQTETTSNGVTTFGSRTSSIADEMRTLNEKDRRNQDLRYENTYNELKEYFAAENYVSKTEVLSPTETRAFMTMLYSDLNHVPKNALAGDYKQQQSFLDDLTGEKANQIIRAWIFTNGHKYSALSNQKVTQAFRDVLEEQVPEPAATVINKYEAVYQKRKAKIDERLAVLTAEPEEAPVPEVGQTNPPEAEQIDPFDIEPIEELEEFEDTNEEPGFSDDFPTEEFMEDSPEFTDEFIDEDPRLED